VLLLWGDKPKNGDTNALLAVVNPDSKTVVNFFRMIRFINKLN